MIVGCKLPHGITIQHGDVEIVLHGANIGERISRPSPNGEFDDNAGRYCGFGLTELEGRKAEAFEEWYNANLYINGDKAKGRMPHAYKPLVSGAITAPFKTMNDCKKELSSLSSMSGLLKIGFEGIIPGSVRNIETVE